VIWKCLYSLRVDAGGRIYWRTNLNILQVFSWDACDFCDSYQFFSRNPPNFPMRIILGVLQLENSQCVLPLGWDISLQTISFKRLKSSLRPCHFAFRNHNQIVYLLAGSWKNHGVDSINFVVILVPMNGLKKAISYYGSKAALARAVGVVPMAVSHWIRRGVPIDKALSIERATNGAVTREELRPDIFLREGVPHGSESLTATPPSSSQHSTPLAPIQEGEQSHG